MNVRFCLSYDPLNTILSPSKIVSEYDQEIPQSQSLFYSMKICIAKKNVIMMLLVPAESLM